MWGEGCRLEDTSLHPPPHESAVSKQASNNNQASKQAFHQSVLFIAQS